MDVENIDEMFEFSEKLVYEAVGHTMREVNKEHLAAKKQLYITFRTLKEYFTIEQIWERLGEASREVLFKELTPWELMDLKEAGYFE